MMRAVYEQHGAVLAPDGIPLHFGDLEGEYKAGLNDAVLLDRSHEGRLKITGQDRFELINRMSTNDVLQMQIDEGRATVFTNPTARVIDRAVAFNADGALWLLAGPGRGEPLRNYLQRNIFFNDQAALEDVTSTTHQFALHGPKAGEIMGAFLPTVSDLSPLSGRQMGVEGEAGYVARLKPLSEQHWVLIVPASQGATVWQRLMTVGQSYGLRPSGGLTFNTLRIRAGVPGTGRELSTDYIPLEIGLWDEVSFNKGCYTGQEIIARMESRNRLAKTIVQLRSEAPLEQGTTLFHNGKQVGKVTSSVTSPSGEHFAIGVVKTATAQPGAVLQGGGTEGTPVEITALAGMQPPQLKT
jgi:folate-binding protein YgfZ